MQKRIEQMKENWEATLFWVSGLLLFLVIGIILYELGTRESTEGQRSAKAPDPGSMLSDNAFEYLKPPKPTTGKKDPFEFATSVRVPYRRPPQQHGNNHNKPGGNKGNNTQQKRNPMADREIVALKYIGWAGAGGAEGRLAFVKITDLKTKKSSSRADLKLGDDIRGLKITQVQEKMLMLENSKGRKYRIPIHKEIRVLIR